jgi:hypothetical protein
MFWCWIGHDIEGKSFPAMFKEIQLPHRIGVKTLQKNVQRIRATVRQWAQEQIYLGTRQSWDAAVADVILPDWLRSVRLWIDSSDFFITRKRGRGKKSEHWSGKANRPARRFMFLVNGDLVIEVMWGGYSPKVYDGHFVGIQKRFFDKNFPGVGVVADSHFASVARELEHCRIFAPKPDGTAPDPVTGANLSKLTAEEQTRNAQIRELRAPVEQVFGQMKNLVRPLSRAWAAELKELDALVTIAAAIHNYRKRL